MSISRSEMIFENWKSDLKPVDKIFKNASEHFYNLFSYLKNDSIDIEEAHKFIEKSVLFYTPPVVVMKRTYKSNANAQRINTEEGFIKYWRQSLEDRALKAFYEVYPLDLQATESKSTELMPNGQTREEYEDYLAYVNSFPKLSASDHNSFDTSSSEELVSKLQGILSRIDDESK